MKLKNSKCDKTQNVAKLENSKCEQNQTVTKLEKTQNVIEKTQKLKLWQNLNNSNCEKKLELWHFSIYEEKTLIKSFSKMILTPW